MVLHLGQPPFVEATAVLEDASDEGRGGEVTSNDLSAPLMVEEKRKILMTKRPATCSL